MRTRRNGAERFPKPMGISFEKRMQGIRLFEEAMLEQKTPKGNSNPSDGQEAVRQVPVHPPDGNLSFLLRFVAWALAWLILAASTAGGFLWGGLVPYFSFLLRFLGGTKDVGHELYISDDFTIVLPFQQASTANALVLALYASYLLVLVLTLFELIKVGKIRTRAVSKVQVTAYGVSWIAVVAVVLAGLVWAMAKPQSLGINSFLLASGMILSPYPVIALLVRGKRVIRLTRSLSWVVYWNWFVITLLLWAVFFLELIAPKGDLLFGETPPIISEFINIDSQIWVWYSFFYFVGGIFFLPFLWISTFLYLPYLVLFILATAYTHFYLIFSISGRLKEIKPRIAPTPILGVLFQYLHLRNGLRALHWNFQTNLILLSWSTIRFVFEVSVIASVIGLAAYTDYSSFSSSGNGFFSTFVSGFDSASDFFSTFVGDFYLGNALIFALLSVPISLIFPYMLLTNRLKRILNGSGTAVVAGAAKPTVGETALPV